MAVFSIRPQVLAGVIGPTAQGVARRTAVAQTDGKDAAVQPQTRYVILTIFLVAAGLLVGILASVIRNPSAIKPQDGISIFALYYLIASVIERVQEPFSPWVGTAKKEDGQTVNQPTAKASRDKAVAEARVAAGDPSTTPAAVDTKATDAAKAQRVVDQIRVNLTLLLWASSSFLAMFASGYFGLRLLGAVGVQNANEWVDIAITGLAIGGGTKPLHDLISNMTDAKKSNEDPPESK